MTRRQGRGPRPPPGVRPLPGPAGEWPRLLAGRRGRARWLDAYGGHAVAATGHCIRTSSAPSRDRRPRCSSTRPPCRARIASCWRSGLPRSAPGSARSGVLLQLGRGGQRECLGLARKPPGVNSSSRCWWLARAHGRRRSRAPTAPGTRSARGGPACRSRTKVPFDDVAALERAVDETVAAVIVEPVQGLSGARDCSPEFLRGRAPRLRRPRRGADLRRGPVRRRAAAARSPPRRRSA